MPRPCDASKRAQWTAAWGCSAIASAAEHAAAEHAAAEHAAADGGAAEHAAAEHAAAEHGPTRVCSPMPPGRTGAMKVQMGKG